MENEKNPVQFSAPFQIRRRFFFRLGANNPKRPVYRLSLYHAAQTFVPGNASLEEQLDSVIDWPRALRLMSRHGMSRSDAVQVTQGKLCIDKVLHRRRRVQHLQEHRSRGIFEAALRDGRPRVFSIHGQEILVARVKAVRAYEVDVLPLGPDRKPLGDLRTVSKIEFKFGCYLDHVPRIQQAMTFSEAERERVLPIRKPQHRYKVSDKKLFGWIDAACGICVKTLEGEMVTGTLSWIGRWEIGLDVLGVELVIFRHALDNIQGIRWDSFKADSLSAATGS